MRTYIQQGESEIEVDTENTTYDAHGNLYYVGIVTSGDLTGFEVLLMVNQYNVESENQ